jgi:hypothetical protein
MGNSLMFRQANQIDARAAVPPSFCKNMRLAAVPEIGRTVILSSGFAANWPQPPLHLIEKPTNLFNRQAVAGQQGVQDRVTEKVIKRGFRLHVAHG